jgi:hypothetical protein
MRHFIHFCIFRIHHYRDKNFIRCHSVFFHILGFYNSIKTLCLYHITLFWCGGFPLSAPFPFFFLVGLGFELKNVHACKADMLLLEPHLQCIFSGYFEDGMLQTICLDCPQAITLLSSLDYRHEPLEGPFSG